MIYIFKIKNIGFAKGSDYSNNYIILPILVKSKL